MGAGISVGLREFQDAARLGADLLAGGQLPELPAALGALLGTSREQSERVEALVAAYLQSCRPPVPPPPQGRSPRRRAAGWRWLVLLPLALLSCPASPPTQPRTTTPPPVAPAGLRPGHLPAEGAPPAGDAVADTDAPRGRRALRIGQHRAVPLLLLPVFCIALAGVQRRRVQRLRAAAVAHARQQLAALPEPTTVVLRPERWLQPPWPHALLDQVAARLTRSPGGAAQGQLLDGELTVRQTSQQAGRPALVYKTAGRAQPLLVLLDVRPHMQPWLARCESLVQGLIQRGVSLEWVCFGGTHCPASATVVDPAELPRCLTESGERPVVVLSVGPQDPSSTAWAWTAHYRQVSRRAWLHPVTQPELWSLAAQQAREALRLLPLTESGLLGASDLLTARISAVPPTLLGAAPSASLDLHGTAVLARLVGQCGPTDPQFAELVRQRLLPGLSPQVLVHLMAAGSDLAGKELRLAPRGGRDAAGGARGQGHSADPRCRAARELLLQVLRDSEPPPGSLAHLRWRLRCCSQQVMLARGNPAAESIALAELQSLAAGPLCEEVLGSLHTLAEPGLAVATKLRRLADRTESALRAGWLPGTRLRHVARLSLWEAALAMVAALLCALAGLCALRLLSPARLGAQSPHRPGAEHDLTPPASVDPRQSERPPAPAQVVDGPPAPRPPAVGRSPLARKQTRNPNPLGGSADLPVTPTDAGPGQDAADSQSPPVATQPDGGAPSDSGSEASPSDLVLIQGTSPFFIERTEVSNHQYERCVRAGACTLPSIHGEACSYGLSGRERYPVNCVSQLQARTYCSWTSRRLPTEKEWELAAAAPGGSPFVWGSGEPPGELCWRRDQGSCVTASMRGDKTAGGVYDLAANLREWVSEPGVTRGGTWHDTDAAQLGVRTRSLVVATERLSDLGFRCARD